MSDDRSAWTVKDWAAWYIAQGEHVVPIDSTAKDPKAPTIKKWQATEFTVDDFRPDFNIGLKGDVNRGMLDFDFPLTEDAEGRFTRGQLVAQALAIDGKLSRGRKSYTAHFRSRTSLKSKDYPRLHIQLLAKGKQSIVAPSTADNVQRVWEGTTPADEWVLPSVDGARIQTVLAAADALALTWVEEKRHRTALGWKTFVLERRLDEKFGEGFGEATLFVLIASLPSANSSDHMDVYRRTTENDAGHTLEESVFAELCAVFGIKKAKSDDEDDESELPRVSYIDLPDGRIAEEILKDGKPMFAIYDPQADSVEFAEKVEIFRPIPVPRELRQVLTLADGVEEYGSTKELLKEMEALALEVYDPMHENKVHQLTIRKDLCEWVIDEFYKDAVEKFSSIVPIVGPSEGGKKRFLTTKRFLTYRGMYFVKTVRVPSLFRAVAPWNARLILDEADIEKGVESNEFIEFLNSRADGVTLTRFSSDKGENQYFNSFGATYLAIRKPYGDDGFNSRAMPVRAETSTKGDDLYLVPPSEWVEKAKRLQRKLLLWRFRIIAKIRQGKLKLPTKLSIDGIASYRIKEALLILKALSDDEPGLWADIVEIAKELQTRLITARSETPEGMILNVIHNKLADGATLVQQGKAWRIDETWVKSENGHETVVQNPLHLKDIYKAFGETYTYQELAAWWRGLGQDLKEQVRIDRKRYKRVLLVTDPERLNREFRKFVVDYKDILNGGQSVPDVPDVPNRSASLGKNVGVLNDIREGTQRGGHTPLQGTLGTLGTPTPVEDRPMTQEEIEAVLAKLEKRKEGAE